MKKIIILAFFISFVALLMALSVYYFYVTPLSEFSYSATAYVTEDSGGFDLNTTAITFGNIMIGGSSMRSILVENPYSFSIRAEPKVDGTISKIINFEPVIVEPNSTAKLYFSVSAYSLDLIGNYSGDISIRLMRG